MRYLEKLNLRSRDLKVIVLFGDDSIDCGRVIQGLTTMYAKKYLSKFDLEMVVVMWSEWPPEDELNVKETKLEKLIPVSPCMYNYSVTEDKVNNDATVLERLELTIFESFWVSDIFETRESLSENSLNALDFYDQVNMRGDQTIWKRIQAKVEHMVWTLWWGGWDCVWWNIWIKEPTFALPYWRRRVCALWMLDLVHSGIRMPRSLIDGVGNMILSERLKFKSGVWLPIINYVNHVPHALLRLYAK